jgi:CDP-paratose 2-epimerase
MYIVTGAGGLIGSAVAQGLMGKGETVIGIDNDSRAQYFGPEASVSNTLETLKSQYKEQFLHYKADIADREAMESLMMVHKRSVRGVIHCAAQPSHDWAAQNVRRDFDVNAMGTMNLLWLTHTLAPEAKFVLLSTNKVYGDQPNYLSYQIHKRRFMPVDKTLHQGFKETLSVDHCLHSFFGVSKLAGDLYAQEYARNFGMEVMVLRGGCLSGRRHQGAELHGFLSYLMKCAINCHPYTLYGYGGYQVRDNVDSGDVWKAIDYFLEADPTENKPIVYNIGGGLNNSVSVLEAIDKVQVLTGNELVIHHGPQRVGDHKWWVTDTQLLEETYGWKPTQTIDDMLLAMYEEGNHE